MSLGGELEKHVVVLAAPNTHGEEVWLEWYFLFLVLTKVKTVFQLKCGRYVFLEPHFWQVLLIPTSLIYCHFHRGKNYWEEFLPPHYLSHYCYC